MYIPDPTPAKILSAIRSIGISKDDVAIILLGEQNCPDIEAVIATLNQQQISFLGGLFPGIIYDNQRSSGGAIVMVQPAATAPVVIPTAPEAIDLSHLKGRVDTSARRGTAVIFADALSSNVAGVLTEIFNHFGSSLSYIGGGAGSLSLKQQPCVFSPEGFFQDAVVVGFLAIEGAITARHGWQRVMGPVVATKTRQNRIVEINWVNAFDLYRSIVEAESGITITKENFFDCAKGYPFGLYKEGTEDIVRDPVGFTEDGELVFVIDIPENAAFNLLSGDADSIVQAAGEAAASAQAPAGRLPRQVFVVDCISRTMYLGECFSRELDMVKAQFSAGERGLTPEGILSLGEIAPDEAGVLQFYNKTIVVGTLHA